MRPFVIFIALVALIAVVDSLFVHFIFPLKKQKIMDRLNHNVDKSLETKPPMDSLKPMGSLDFSSATRKCLGTEYQKFSSFPDEYSAKYPIKNKLIEIENFHLRTPEKRAFRLHVLKENPTTQQIVQLFEITSEATPQPIPLSVDERNMPSEQLVETIKARGEIFYHEVKERWHLTDGQVLIVTFQDKTLTEFQLFTDTKTFTCEQDQCYCF